jgi:DNA modification methylase
MAKIEILQGNVFDKLKELNDNSIDCVVTSPPYWGLRDYGVDDQLGLEPTYQEHIKNIVNLFKQIKPKLKDSATVWLNYGDCYATAKNGRDASNIIGDDRTFRNKPFSTIQGKLKNKDLVMMPNRIAIALQDDGWWIRSEIIWHKPNPMPESIKDRPTSSHEKIWLITKSKNYYYDHESIKEPVKNSSKIRLNQNIENQKGSTRANGGMKSNGNMKAVGYEKRNKRNVWTVSTKPCKEAHFATFPKDLIEPCIKAGCPEGGVVLDPFGGSGTTGIVAALNNRKSILIELNKNYIEIANKRIEKEVGLFI